MKRNRKQIPGLPDYEATADGHVYRKGKSKPHKPSGQNKVSLYGAPHSLPRLILTAFVGPPRPGQRAVHIDHDRTNNRLDNLEWGPHAL